MSSFFEEPVVRCGTRALGRGLSLLVVACLSAVHGTARADEADQKTKLWKLGRQVDGIGARIAVLAERYREAKVQKPARPFVDRLQDGETLLALGDVESGGLLLLDLVGEVKRGEIGLRKADYERVLAGLAEAMFRIDNERLARRYYAELAQEASGERLVLAVRRLTQIAEATADWDGVRSAMDRLESTAGRIPADINYAWARNRLRQNDYPEAIRALSQVDPQSPYYAKALYLRAVATLQLGDRSGATVLFGKASRLDRPFGYDSGSEVRAMSTLNVGRLLLDGGNLRDATSAYSRVEKDSQVFAESLYERAWIHIQGAFALEDSPTRKAEMAKAQGLVERFLDTQPDPARAAEARLLAANLQLEQDRPNEAQNRFSDVIERYSPARDEVERMAATLEDPEQFLLDLLSTDLEQTGMVSKVAAKSLVQEKELLQAVQLIVDLAQTELWMYETAKLVLEILTAMHNAKRVPPGLEEGYAELLELDSAINVTQQKLLGLQRKAIEEVVGSDQLQQELHKVLAERAELDPQYAALPKSREEYEKHLAHMLAALARIDKAVFHLKLPLDEMRREMQKIQTWIRYKGSTLRPEPLARVKSHADSLDADLKTQQSLIFDLTAIVEQERNRVSIANADSHTTVRLRRRYSANLTRERDILNRLAAHGAGSALLEDLNRQHAALAGHKQRIGELKRMYLGLADDTSGGVRGIVDQVWGEFEAQLSSVEELRAELTSMVRGATLHALGKVQDLFHRIVLRADLGVVDVAWRLKEHTTREINQRVAQQRDDLMQYDESYGDLIAMD